MRTIKRILAALLIATLLPAAVSAEEGSEAETPPAQETPSAPEPVSAGDADQTPVPVPEETPAAQPDPTPEAVQPEPPQTQPDPVEPEEPESPGTQPDPEEAENPEGPGTQPDPDEPEEPEDPGTQPGSAEPEEPEDPGTQPDPEEPENPEDPGTQPDPEEPEEPEDPGTQPDPEEPEDPEDPGTQPGPDEPEDPEELPDPAEEPVAFSVDITMEHAQKDEYDVWHLTLDPEGKISFVWTCTVEAESWRVVLTGPDGEADRTEVSECRYAYAERDLAAGSYILTLTAAVNGEAVGSRSLHFELESSEPEEVDLEEPDPEGPDLESPDPEGTDPENPDPEATDPVEPDPEGTDPENPDPEATDPVEPDPEGTDPENPDPEGTDPVEPDPEGTDPENPDPEATDPVEPDPEGTYPENPDPEATGPVEPDPEGTDPENPDPEITDPEEPDPEGTDPEEPDPEDVDPEEPERPEHHERPHGTTHRFGQSGQSGGGVTPGKALTSTHASGTGDLTPYDGVKLTTSGAAAETLVIGGEQIGVDCGGASFTASLSRDVLQLRSGASGWHFTLAALNTLSVSGVRVLSLSTQDGEYRLDTALQLTGSAYAAERSEGFVSADFAFSLIDGSLTVTVEDRVYRLNGNELESGG